MKKLTVAIAAMMIMSSGLAMAFGIATLDKVSVHMTKVQVVSLLGTPDRTDKAAGGLLVEVYKVENAEPLVGAGCIYDDDRRVK